MLTFHRVPWSLVVAGLIALGLSACARSGAPPVHGTGVAARGERIYAAYCATCHGVSGDGRGPSAEYLVGRPPADFGRGFYKYGSTERGSLPTDADLVWTILRGVPGTSMPAWAGVLDENDARDVAVYLKTFSPRFADPALEARPITMPASRPPSTVESRERGRALFLLAQCWQCHGVDAKGNGPAAKDLVDELGRHVQPANLTSGFRSGGAPAELYRVLVTGVDGTPMVPAPLPVVREHEQQVAALDGSVAPAELERLRTFARSLRSSDELFALTEVERQSIIEGWRWDLVDYLTTLPRRSRWPSLLGTEPAPALYGGRPCDALAPPAKVEPAADAEVPGADGPDPLDAPDVPDEPDEPDDNP